MSEETADLPSGPLPPHTPICMVCGPESKAGYDLRAHWDGDEVIADFTFGTMQAGAPGIAHGGAVSAVCDDLLGHVLTSVRIPAVTRYLEVEYLKPVILGERHRLVARKEGEEGRKVWIRCEAYGEDGGLRFTARGLFIRVGWSHFLAGLPPDERARAEEKLAEARAAGKDVSAW
jgi:acyl-coenzyme A thioesterase PaaI-like protein